MFSRNCFRSLFLLIASCTLLLLVSCQSSQDETIVPEGQCTITFSVTNYRQISFDDLSSAGTRADIPSDHPATLAHLLMAVFDAETGQQACSQIQHDYKDFEEKPSEYRQFSVTLPYGHYRVLFLGYNDFNFIENRLNLFDLPLYLKHLLFSFAACVGSFSFLSTTGS